MRRPLPPGCAELDQVDDIDLAFGGGDVERARVGLAERQQCRGEAAHAGHLSADRCQVLAQLTGPDPPAERDIHLALDESERRAKLVRGVRGESLQALVDPEHVLGAVAQRLLISLELVHAQAHGDPGDQDRAGLQLR